ncbi:helix-turn-helix domain-containing protein [uncultured Alistipes sp.]|uniref:helix-turn-helix domain-containing protein n=1 Tax=uncultured Alistipes sp. TaxID=538949 RepID=UPI00265FB4E2|nr:helix-turn-helix domain-containing protein [uncultured Alistipes sp.]
MNQKQHAPGVQGRRAGALYQVLHKGKEFFLTCKEFRLYSLLLRGDKLATFDLAERLNIPDPRSTIRYLRNMGIEVSDIWVYENRTKFKRYFIRGGAQL